MIDHTGRAAQAARATKFEISIVLCRRG